MLEATKADKLKLPPLRLFIEKRFPLEMNVTLPEIRALYDSGKAGRWNPHKDIDWDQLQPDTYDAATREAARRTWSRRLWLETEGLTETPALIVRFCMEAGREIDPKFFLTVRNTEEAWHVECFERIAQAFGGPIERPADPAYEAVFNRNLRRRVMNADQHLDSYVACFSAFEDGLELELSRVWRANAQNNAIASVLDRVVDDKGRHAAFGWLYLESRSRAWDESDRANIAAELVSYIHDSLLKGYLCPWLAPDQAAAETDADSLSATAGLGAASRDQEEQVLTTYVSNARRKLAEFGVILPLIETNRMKAF